MITSMLEKKEVKDLLTKISNNPRYYDKKKKDSINYEKFSGLEQPFFLVMDSLLKYQILIGDEEYFSEYAHHLELLWHKIDNFHDINEGVSKILVKFVAKKLGYKNVEENRRGILKYIYDKYIVDGYLFHAISSVYVDDIKEKGFSPQQYDNYYEQFMEIQDKYPSFFRDMDFSHDYVNFTDDFVMACYYAVYSPSYFSSFLCPATSKKVDVNSYARKDYMGCFKNLHQLLKSREINEVDSKKIEKLCNDEWKLLKQNEAVPTIMLVKRSLLGKDSIYGIDDILNNQKEDIGTLANRIMDYKYDSLSYKDFIPKEDITFITIPYYDFVLPHDDESLKDVELPTVKVTHSEDGRVSFLVLVGSLLILFGVLASIIMLYS